MIKYNNITKFCIISLINLTVELKIKICNEIRIDNFLFFEIILICTYFWP